MQSIEIFDIKKFMQLLFQTNFFDSYEFVSCDLSTDLSYVIDGHIHKSFFSEDELSILQLSESTYFPWNFIKEKLFFLIKGKKTPTQLKMILKLSSKQLEDFLRSTQSHFSQNEIDGLFLNILFQENNLKLICGISYSIFTMDKQLESDFSNSIIALLRTQNVTCE